LLPVSSVDLTQVGVYVCVCVYARTDTHCTDGVIGIKPRSTGSMLSPTQSGNSSWEPSPTLPLGRGRYHCTANCFSGGRAQPTWIRKPSTTTPLAETHGTGSRGCSASTQRPRCLPWQLGRQTEPRSRLQSHKAPSPHQAPLQQMLSRSSGKVSAQIMVGDHGHILSFSPAERQKLVRIA